MKKSFLAIFLFICSYIFGQNPKIDSLFTLFNNKALADTIRLQAIQNIAWSLRNNNPDSAIILAEQELQLAKDKKQKKWQAYALKIIGVSFLIKSDYPKALDYQFRSLKINEEITYKKGVANSLNNIGLVYYALQDNTKALAYHFRCLKIQEELDNKEGIANSLNNIGNVYNALSEYPKALNYQLQSLKIMEEIGDKQGIAYSLTSIGNIYIALSGYKTALDYYLRSLKIMEELGNKQGIILSIGNIGEAYLKQKQYTAALQYSIKAVQLCKEIGDLNSEKEFQITIYKMYKAKGNGIKALEHYERYVLLRDSIFKEENQKQIMRKEMTYEYEKKEIAAKAAQEKLDAITGEEKQKQQIVIYAVAGVLLLVIIFSLFLFNRFRITQQQKKVIEEQKVLVDKAYETLHEKNKEVMDSINYASRIQRALLPSQKYISNSLNRLRKG